MRILITGAAGMLGTDARRILAAQGHTIIATDRSGTSEAGAHALDVTDVDAVHALFAETQPEIVLHCAAYTNVDGAERDPDAAYKVNALGTWAVACAVEEAGAVLVFVSTDFVFDGTKSAPYTEFDTPNPLGYYGASKLAGECVALAHCRRCFVVRTSWLYGTHGKNFPFAILNQAKTKGELFVVADQTGTPTYTVDLVHAISEMMKSHLYGIYHVSNAGATSWHGFAETLLEKTGWGHVSVHPLTSDEAARLFNTPTRRPKYSVLRHYALELQGKDTLRPWQDALDDFIVEARSVGLIPAA